MHYIQEYKVNRICFILYLKEISLKRMVILSVLQSLKGNMFQHLHPHPNSVRIYIMKNSLIHGASVLHNIRYTVCVRKLYNLLNKTN